GVRRWSGEGPIAGMGKRVWSGIEGAALEVALASRIAWRSEPGPESFEFVTLNGRVTSAAAMSWENSELSPVLRLVAVALTWVPTGKAMGTAARITPLPLASVVTVTEPIIVWPWPNPDVAATAFEKNWTRKLVPAVPWIVPRTFELSLPEMTEVSTGKFWKLLGPAAGVAWLGVTPSPPRSMPSRLLPKTRFER